MLVRHFLFLHVHIGEFVLVTNGESFVRPAGDVHHRGEFNVLLVHLFVLVTTAELAMLRVKIVELNQALLFASCETEIVLEPVNASDLLDTTSEIQVLWCILLVEVENLDLVIVDDAREHVTSMSKSNLIAAFNCVLFNTTQSRRKHVENLNLVGHRHHDVQT